MWSRSRLNPKGGDQKYHLHTPANKKDHAHLKVDPRSRVGRQDTALNFRKREEDQLEHGNLRYIGTSKRILNLTRMNFGVLLDNLCLISSVKGRATLV